MQLPIYNCFTNHEAKRLSEKAVHLNYLGLNGEKQAALCVLSNKVNFMFENHWKVWSILS